MSNNNSVTWLFCNLADKEFKISVLKKLNKLYENLDRQFNKLWKNVQNEVFTKEIKIIKKNQSKILMNSTNEVEMQYRTSAVK